MEVVFLEPNEKRAFPFGNKRRVRQRVSEIALQAGPAACGPDLPQTPPRSVRSFTNSKAKKGRVFQAQRGINHRGSRK